jgi:hypothetical protein
MNRSDLLLDGSFFSPSFRERINPPKMVYHLERVITGFRLMAYTPVLYYIVSLRDILLAFSCTAFNTSSKGISIPPFQLYFSVDDIAFAMVLSLK